MQRQDAGVARTDLPCDAHACLVGIQLVGNKELLPQRGHWQNKPTHPVEAKYSAPWKTVTTPHIRCLLTKHGDTYILLLPSLSFLVEREQPPLMSLRHSWEHYEIPGSPGLVRESYP